MARGLQYSRVSGPSIAFHRNHSSGYPTLPGTDAVQRFRGHTPLVAGADGCTSSTLLQMDEQLGSNALKQPAIPTCDSYLRCQ